MRKEGLLEKKKQIVNVIRELKGRKAKTQFNLVGTAWVGYGYTDKIMTIKIKKKKKKSN